MIDFDIQKKNQENKINLECYKEYKDEKSIMKN